MKKKLAIIGAILALVLSVSLVGCIPEGATGTPGITGMQGIQGIQGIQGSKGDTGAKGIQGDRGEQGKQGVKGDKGNEGDEGDEGDRGDRGYTGNTGATGATGAIGATGTTGTDGIDGINGIDGADGTDGTDGTDGIDGTAGIDAKYQAFMILVQKGEDWAIIQSNTVALLKYVPVNDTFEFELEAYNLIAGADYSLIYYADPWPGAGGCLIDSETANSSGHLILEGLEDIGSIPVASDDNIDDDNRYANTPDYYAHTHGAKIWLVLSNDYSEVEGEMIDWNPESYLFETDLIYYIDTD